MGWLSKEPEHYRCSCSTRIKSLNEEILKLQRSENLLKGNNDILVERYQEYLDTNARLNTYIDKLTQKQDAPRRYRVTFNNGPSDIEVKATHFEARPENGYNFYDKTGVSKLTAHFDYDIVAYVLEITEN